MSRTEKSKTYAEIGRKLPIRPTNQDFAEGRQKVAE